MADPTLTQLGVPPDAQEQGGHEILRAFIVDGGLSVALQRAFDDPATWGILLADVARHVARIFATEGGVSEVEALEHIHRMFQAEWSQPTDLGTTSATN
ncbi:protein of unknown function [Rhizobiales bacterium GAS191]|jgi:hypothetical protein|nr:protein of unknown function [Rhizobiales bacterium GAS113]SED65559.1 protein of unknown function [Rhizobiales bacterium GAS191]